MAGGADRRRDVRPLRDLSIALFQVFWILGWSVGVVVLGALAVLLLTYGESARLAGGRLIHVTRLGPLKTVMEYDLARLRGLRLESAGGGARMRLRFDYRDGSRRLGDAMPADDAGRLLAAIRAAAPSGVDRGPGEPETPERPAPPAAAPATPPPRGSPAVPALVAANLVPLAGVLFAGWSLSDVLVLYWAESADRCTRRAFPSPSPARRATSGARAR